MKSQANHLLFYFLYSVWFHLVGNWNVQFIMPMIRMSFGFFDAAWYGAAIVIIMMMNQIDCESSSVVIYYMHTGIWDKLEWFHLNKKKRNISNSILTGQNDVWIFFYFDFHEWKKINIRVTKISNLFDRFDSLSRFIVFTNGKLIATDRNSGIGFVLFLKKSNKYCSSIKNRSHHHDICYRFAF